MSRWRRDETLKQNKDRIEWLMHNAPKELERCKHGTVTASCDECSQYDWQRTCDCGAPFDVWQRMFACQD